jgi:hypothetical protein
VDEVTNNNEPTLIGGGAAGSTITVSDGITTVGTTTVDSQGNWSLTVGSPLADGTYDISAVASSASGAVSAASAPVAVTILTTPPVTPTLTLAPDSETDPETPDSTSANIIGLDGITSPDALVTVMNGTQTIGSTTADITGNWTLTTPMLPDGTYDFTATATDIVGNVSDLSSPYALTITAPTISLNAADPLSNAVVAALQTLLGNSWASGAPVTADFYTTSEIPLSNPGTATALSIGDSDSNSVIAVPTTVNLVVAAASGPVTVNGAASSSVIVDSDGGDMTFNTDGGSGSFIGTNPARGTASDDVNIPLNALGQYLIDTGAGNDTINAASGNNTVNAGGGFNSITLGTGTNIVLSEGLDSIDGGSGEATVTVAAAASIQGGSGSMLIYGNSGSINFSGGLGRTSRRQHHHGRHRQRDPGRWWQR